MGRHLPLLHFALLQAQSPLEPQSPSFPRFVPRDQQEACCPHLMGSPTELPSAGSVLGAWVPGGPGLPCPVGPDGEGSRTPSLPEEPGRCFSPLWSLESGSESWNLKAGDSMALPHPQPQNLGAPLPPAPCLPLSCACRLSLPPSSRLPRVGTMRADGGASQGGSGKLKCLEVRWRGLVACPTAQANG